MVKGLLFSSVDIFSVLQHQEQVLKNEVNELDTVTIEGVPEAELIHRLASKHKIELPVLEEEKAYITHQETDVDVSGDPMRIIWDRSKPFYLKGTEITVHIPFKGDPSGFEIQPSTFNLAPPRAYLTDSEILLIYTRTDTNAEAVTTEYKREMENVRKHLGWLETSVADFNKNVGQQVQNLVAQRRKRLVDAAGMISAIGLPVKRTNPLADSRHQLRTNIFNKSINSSKKWDVFISHASEDKAGLVRPLAEALRASGLAVWYDEFSLKMGDSLRGSIDFGLVNSRFGVVVLSKSFFEKHWPAQELNGLANREVSGKKVILPIWHNVTADEVRGFSPILADRLASRSDTGVSRLVEDIMEVLEQD